MALKKLRSTPAGARPYRLQSYLTEEEGEQVQAFAAMLGVTASLAARELIRRALAHEKEEDDACLMDDSTPTRRRSPAN